MAKKDPEKSRAGEEAPASEPAAKTPAVRAPLRDGWRDRWQIPTLAAATLVLALGLAAWVRGAPPPDFPAALDHVQKLIDDGKYEAAIALLNDPIRVNMQPEMVPAAILGRYFILSGDALYLGQKARQVDVPENHEAIITNYRGARSGLSTPLTATQEYRLADSLISIGRVAEAMDELARMPDAAAQHRHMLMRRIIDLHLTGRQATLDPSGVMRMLGELRTDPRVSTDDRLWAATRQAELRLAAGFPEDALLRLIPEVQRLGTPMEERVGPLYLLMGEASLELGRLDEARKYFALALEVVPAIDPVAGRALVGVGRASQLASDDEQAAEWFTEAIARFPLTDAAMAAQLGLGEVLSRRGQRADSIAAYEAAIEGLGSSWTRGIITAQDIADSLAQRHEEWFATGDSAAALQYAKLIERIHPDESMPADALARIAGTQRAYADDLIEGAVERPDGTLDLSALDPVSVEEARRHYREAARYFQKHAERRLLGSPEEATNSLWLAADSFDRAGDLDSAIQAFNEFVATQDESPMLEQASFRLARAYQARGDFTQASDLYDAIIRRSPESMFAYRSYVPLAQCLALAPESAQPERAEDLLREVLSSGIFEPEAPEFKAARIELGRLYRRQGDHDRAIAQLREAKLRYQELNDDPSIVFALADSLRQSAEQLGRDLETPRPPSERSDLRVRRGQQLREALDGFTRTRELIEQRDPRRLVPMDRSLLKNAILYRADCAFDMARLTAEIPEGMLEELFGQPVLTSSDWYEQAVAFYDTAAQRYADDPISLTAMVQIVNAYMAMDKPREARTAHERARARLAELPDQAFDSDATSMTRDAWESWLAASVRLDRMAGATP
ncbi:MAG: tetratricopeptide repeat protein [Phycisphaerales bacterium]